MTVSAKIFIFSDISHLTTIMGGFSRFQKLFHRTIIQIFHHTPYFTINTFIIMLYTLIGRNFKPVL